MAKHAFVYLEWLCTDLERARAFYGGLFDWEFKPMGEGYLEMRPPEGLSAGLQQVEKVKPGESPVVYVEVDEIEPYLEKAGALGGGVAVPKTEIPGLGWYAHLTDPDGSIVGLFQSGRQE